MIDFDAKVRQYEAEMIGWALRKADGRVTQAARLLGMTHQRLSAILAARHKGLQVRQPVKRLRSIVKKEAGQPKK